MREFVKSNLANFKKLYTFQNILVFYFLKHFITLFKICCREGELENRLSRQTDKIPTILLELLILKEYIRIMIFQHLFCQIAKLKIRMGNSEPAGCGDNLKVCFCFRFNVSVL